MKSKVLTAALAVVLGAGLSVARAQDAAAQGQQGGRRWQADPQQQVHMLQSRLNLTDDQVTQVRQILTDGRKQMQAARQDGSLVGQDRMAKFRAIREDQENRINAVLTPDQKTKYQAMREQFRARRQQQRDQNQDTFPNQ